MTNYRSTEESLVLSPRMEKVHANILTRLKNRNDREGTGTAEVGADGKNPFLDVFMENPDAPYVICLAKEAGISTCVETSGYADPAKFREAAAYVDTFLFDYKATGEDMHRMLCGVGQERILGNLAALDELGGTAVLRCPIIPEVNDNAEYFAYVAELANSLEHLLEVHLQPYHATGLSKARDIGVSDVFTAENYDASAFKERIRNELLPIITKSVSQKVVL